MKILNVFQRFENHDERIQSELADLTAKLYPVMLILAVVVGLFKLTVLKLSYNLCILESMAVVISIGYYFIRTKMAGLSFTYGEDDFIKGIQKKYLCHSFYIAFYIMIMGGIVSLIFVDENEILYQSLSLIVWLIPAVILTYKIVKKGLMIVGTKKQAHQVLRKFKRNVVIGSLFYGIFMNWNHLIVDNSFNVAGIKYVILSSVIWGIPFYWIMKIMFQISGKQADKAVESE